MPDKHKDIEHWSRIATEWMAWARAPNHDAFWAYRASLLAFIGQGAGDALDVGCGEGRVSRVLKECGYRVTAIDPVEKLISAALTGGTPWEVEPWTIHFLAALAEEAEAGTEFLRLLEREWFAARSAVRDRRRDSRAAVAVDIMAASPVVSATSLAGGLGIAVKNASALLEGFVERGIAIEVTHRSKRRLYGLKHLAPQRDEAAPPRRPTPGRSRGRPPRGAAGPATAAEYSEASDSTLPLPDRSALSPLERKEFDFTDIDDWICQADQAILRTKAVLDQLATAGRPATPGSNRH